MKIDRLLSIIIYLLNRDLVSARELSNRFEVSIRTIQRDMETIDLAGVPVISIQGPNGGYGIMDTYKMDRQLLSMDDLYYIITALKGIGSSIEDKKIDNTIEKITGLVPELGKDLFHEKNEKLHIDFSMLGGNAENRRIFAIINKAVESERLVNFSYTNNKFETVIRTVEPMTMVFRWRAWYLFGYCRLKDDYRIFRISRIKEPEILAGGFKRRDKAFDDFNDENRLELDSQNIELKLRFSTVMKPLIEEFYGGGDIVSEDEKSLTVRLMMPESGWLYGYILSFGEFVEVLEPAYLRSIIRGSAEKIASIYE
ncbi:MAG: YafY family transcriptional regulator [Spirochaetales bacterium]|nr:YafY family transcriptional regulator [Spirochaetales bacterium]